MILRVIGTTPEPVFEVAWSAMPKHSDVTITTGGLTVRQLETCIRGEAPLQMEITP